MTYEKIIDRVKKLLAQATSSNEHEAALAASMAQELMLKHQISEAALLQDTDPVEEVIEFALGEDTRPYAWRSQLITGVTGAFGCQWFYRNNPDGGAWVGPKKARVLVIGTESNRNAVQYMFSYLVNEVNRLADEAWKREVQEYLKSGLSKESMPAAQGWKLSFRLGAASVISSRLSKQREKTFKEAKKDESNSTALVRIADAETRIQAYKGKLRLRTGSIGRDSSAQMRSGYGVGVEAGKNVNISAGKGLKGARGQLKS
jgi:hypothetical protein